MMSKWREHWPVVVAILLLVVNSLVWSAVWRQSRGVLTVAFLDIGQGDAIYIEAPNGNQVLVDGGSGRQVLRALAAVMPFYDHSIDLVVGTHPDADHIGGLASVIERFAVGMVMESGLPSETNTYKSFRAAVAAKHLRTIYARRGMRIWLDRAVYLDLLWPVASANQPLDPARWKNTNDASIVGRLVYGTESFLLTGDAPIRIEQYLLNLDGRGLESVVLKTGHHGSRTSSAPAFVAAVAPTEAVVSAGKNNRYGHPHQEVLDILTKAGATIFRTDERGTIVFETDGETLTLCPC